jgi:predicted glutamine amidotransferase
MCELLAMSSSHPTRVSYSMREFARHGGLTADNADGWGIAFLEDRNARIFRDTDAAAESPSLRLVSSVGFRSETVVCHIRKATQGEVALRNTQPFARELGGRIHVFAHNGDLQGVTTAPEFGLGCHLPIGETDSEHAFCNLLHRLRPLWSGGRKIPELAERLAIVAAFASEIRCLGPANFIYADGDTVFLHGDKRKTDDGDIKPPGLHLLHRSREAASSPIEVPGLTITSDTQHVVLAASVPLTGEDWAAFSEGEVVAVCEGKVIR